MNSAEELRGPQKAARPEQAASSRPASPLPADPLSVARQRARDAWLFLLLGAVALVAAWVIGGLLRHGDPREQWEMERFAAFMVAFASMAVLLVLASWKFVRARWAGLKTPSLTAGLWLIGLCDIFLLLCVVMFLPCSCERVRFPILAAIPLSGLALGLGVWAAGWRRADPPSRRCKVAFVSILASSLLAISIPTMGMLGTLFDSGKVPICPWTSYLPEWVRSPVAAVTLEVWPSSRHEWVRMGIAPVWLLREQALQTGSGDAWHWWAFRAPDEALAEALTVSCPTTPRARGLDSIAGYIIGQLGSEKEILDRMREPYSYELKNGVHEGIEGTTVAIGRRQGFGNREVSREVAEALANYLMSAPPEYPSQILMPFSPYPDLARRLIKHWLAQPFSPSGLPLYEMQDLWMENDKDHEILLAALQSSDFRVRAVALYQIHRYFLRSCTRIPAAVLIKVIETAEGSRSDANPEERRYAANILRATFGGTTPESLYSYSEPLGPGAPPLTKAEERSIKETCLEARKKLADVETLDEAKGSRP